MKKKEILKKKAEMFDATLIFLQGICGADIMFLQTNNPQKDTCLRFNVHGIIAFITKYLVDTKIGLPAFVKTDFVNEWEKHVEEVLNPIYMAELEKMKKGAIEKKTKSDFYS